MMEADSGSVRKTDRTQELLRNRTVLDHLPLVMAIAARVRENLPLQVDVDDLISAGLRGLFAAATKNRRRKNLLFDSYVRHRIKAAILDSLRTAFPAQQEFPDRIRKEELIEMLKSAMATVPEPYQKAMIMYYTTDMTMKDIGGLLGISERRISEVHKTALEKMAIKLQSSGLSGRPDFS